MARVSAWNHPDYSTRRELGKGAPADSAYATLLARGDATPGLSDDPNAIPVVGLAPRPAGPGGAW